MSRHHPGHANPLTLVLLGVPALMILGALKACDAASDAVRTVTARPSSGPPAAAAPPRYRLEIEKGWRI